MTTGGHVRLRIFPREESYFDLFDLVAANLADAARKLLDMVEDFVDPEMKAKRLVDAEHEGDRLTYAIYSRLNSTFITPFDREDIHALAGHLDDVLDAIEEAADMLVLHKVLEPIDAVIEQARLIDQAARATVDGLRNLRGLKQEPLRAYLININDLENQGDQLYRRARADLYDFNAEHPARYVLIWKDIVEQLEEALDHFEHVAHTVEAVIIKHA
jgi:predicted phosphate transport protein (TIGR00153 family)